MLNYKGAISYTEAMAMPFDELIKRNDFAVDKLETQE